MELEAEIRNLKDLHASFLNYLDSDDESSKTCFQELINCLLSQGITQNHNKLHNFFHLISIISDNRHRKTDFFSKLKELFSIILESGQCPLTNMEIFKIFEENKQVLLILFETQMIIPDEPIMSILMKKKDSKGFKYNIYLYKSIKQFIGKRKQKMLEAKITKKMNEKISEFEKKCQEGENDSYICQLIRNDSVEEFITLVNRNNLPLTSNIPSSYYETNRFLIEREKTSLIEYSALFEAIQIFQYLKNNGVELNESLWMYAIRSNSAEIISIIEDNVNIDDDMLYEKYYIEAIKCHHIEVSEYIRNCLLKKKEVVDGDDFLYNRKIASAIIESQNYFNLPDDINELIVNPRLGIPISSFNFSLSKITIPSSVPSIGPYAFSEFLQLEEIEFQSPSSLKRIEYNAFEKCSSLKEIKIPSSVTYIGKYCFSECKSLFKIEIPSSVTSFGQRIFDGVESIEITGDVKKIPADFFFICTSVKCIKINAPVTSIEANAFYKCTSLIDVNIPPSVTTIGVNAFNNCSLLKKILIPPSVTVINDFAFACCSLLTEILIPSSIKEISNGTFKKCSALTEILIPSSVIKIGDEAFAECSGLEQVTFENPSSVKSIGNKAFYECSNLTNILIPFSVTQIKDTAFSRCYRLKNIAHEKYSS